MTRSGEEQELVGRRQEVQEAESSSVGSVGGQQHLGHSHQFQPGQNQLHHQFQQQQQQEQQQNYDQQQQQQQQAGSGDDSSASNKPKRNPFCSRCRNHGKSAQVKGHKRHCEYRDCQCEGCKLVECRQIVSAAQIKRRRYQKQDEECGRRIEISPPVLKREPSTDPAALIAKTLIGSKAQQQQPPPPPQSAQVVVGPMAPLQPGQHHPNHHHHHNLHQTLVSPAKQHHLSLAVVDAATAAAAAAAAANHHPHHHPHHHQHHHPRHLQQGGPGPMTVAGSADGTHQPPINHDLASSALINALHLIQFPNSMLAQPPSQPHHQQLPGSLAINLPASLATASASNTNPNPSPASLPSIREQINLVEEIHDIYGPLAVYAWLRAEQFNLQKVRDLIELSRVSFDELLQIAGHSPLDLTSPVVD